VAFQPKPGRPKTLTPRVPRIKTAKTITARPVRAAVIVFFASITASGDPCEVAYLNPPEIRRSKQIPPTIPRTRDTASATKNSGSVARSPSAVQTALDFISAGRTAPAAGGRNAIQQHSL